ncbi:MAG: hypothetical protein MI810_24970 [Flavobacteriales bacterium]|nr:hypothetical protein [Flavobacteriales bacterium]
MNHTIHEIREGLIGGLVVFLILELLTLFIYINAINAQKGEIFEGLFRTTKVIRTLIDPQKHMALDSPVQEDFPIYLSQIEPLKKALDSDSTIEFIYTMIQIDTTIHFILDPTDPGTFDENGVETKAHVMEVYENPSEALVEAFEEEKMTVTEEVYYDQWGGHISCYAPLVDDTKFIGVIGVDISTETYNERLQPIKDATQRTMVTILFISYLSGLVIWFLRRIHKKMMQKTSQST